MAATYFSKALFQLYELEKALIVISENEAQTSALWISCPNRGFDDVSVTSEISLFLCISAVLVQEEVASLSPWALSIAA